MMKRSFVALIALILFSISGQVYAEVPDFPELTPENSINNGSIVSYVDPEKGIQMNQLLGSNDIQTMEALEGAFKHFDGFSNYDLKAIEKQYMEAKSKFENTLKTLKPADKQALIKAQYDFIRSRWVDNERTVFVLVNLFVYSVMDNHTKFRNADYRHIVWGLSIGASRYIGEEKSAPFWEKAENYYKELKKTPGYFDDESWVKFVDELELKGVIFDMIRKNIAVTLFEGEALSIL